MKLLYQTHSPYARKVLVFAHEARLAADIQVVHQETSPMRANAEVYAQNPLGKTKQTKQIQADPSPETTSALFDSNVICEYLDTRHQGRPLVPREGEARWQALRIQAVASGLADVGIAVRWETTRRPETLRYPELSANLSRKLVESFDWLERELDVDVDGKDNDEDGGGAVHVGHIALATALSWLLFRGVGEDFRQGRPRLAAWFERFESRPSMKATPLSGETLD
ncbi:glutathione S-transferase [Trichophyton tonsurans CBS 112818]|uniref:Glutathione S-transferase n=1 Tax=Trichophyton tonsurans (strain CBS 112818) TaxID=647933 RepID=F2S7P7_TRIT1|nr:glutathione S-transferase [Trichophyton tonsurans CBS 112818]